MAYDEGNKVMTEVFPGLKVYELNDLMDNYGVLMKTIGDLKDLTRPQGLALLAKIRAKRVAEEVCMAIVSIHYICLATHVLCLLPICGTGEPGPSAAPTTPLKKRNWETRLKPTGKHNLFG